MAHYIKLATPSNGQNEVLRALHRRNARGGRTRSLSDVTRFCGPHYNTADVQTVLTALQSAGYATNPSGDQWGLTTAGLQYIRSRPNSRFVAA